LRVGRLGRPENIKERDRRFRKGGERERDRRERELGEREIDRRVSYK
jgi:hypothetical protein